MSKKQSQHKHNGRVPGITDYGPDPFVVNVDEAALRNNNYRAALWTGNLMQMTLMSIPVSGEIGLELHEDTDQFIKLVRGYGLVMMGSDPHRLSFQRHIREGYGVFVPAGTWHNIVNAGNTALKLYTLYAPAHHPHGVIEPTKSIADAREGAGYITYY